MQKARGIPGLLDIHAVVDNVHHDLHVPLGLHGTAHQAETHQRRAVLHQEGRDDGVEGALARGIGVRVIGIQ